jgi:hypothetical protein
MSRLDLGKRKRLSTIHNRSLFAAKQEVFPSHSQREDFAKTILRLRYGVGEEVGEEVVLIVVLDSVVVDVAGEGFTTVVLLSVFFSAGGLTVSVFCSQAASKDAAPAKMQMYFFISCDGPYWVTQIFGASRHFGLADMELCRSVKLKVKTPGQRAARGLRQRLGW